MRRFLSCLSVPQPDDAAAARSRRKSRPPPARRRRTTPSRSRVGAVIYTDYTYTKEPTTKDADGNTINSSAFNVSRAYINITGNISHMVAFRITPDVTARQRTPGRR